MASYRQRHVYRIPLSQEPSNDIKFSLWHTFKHHIPRFILTILFDLILPLVLFLVLEKHINSVYALLIAGAPPLVMIFFRAIISRSLDALGFLVFVAFVISAVVALISKNATLLLLEKSLITGILSILFAVTLIPFRCCKHRCTWRPAAYYFYQDLLPVKRADVGLPDSVFDNLPESMNEDEESVQKLSKRKEASQVYEWIYTHCRSFRISCYVTTAIWAVGFLIEFLCRLTLILVHLSTEQIVIYGNVILGVVAGICIILTIICIVIERKKTLALIKQWKEKNMNRRQRQLRRLEYSVWMLEYNFISNNVVYEKY